MDHESGLASNFINYTVGRSATSSINATDLGLSVLVDFASDTWVSYRRDTEDAATWTAHIWTGAEELTTVATDLDLPNHFVIATEVQGDDVWIGTGHGLARGRGIGYYDGVQPPAEEKGEAKGSEP
jgi:hypothetical protein